MACVVTASTVILICVQCVLTVRIPLRRMARQAETSPLEVSLSLTRLNWNYYADITVGTAREGEADQVFSVMFDTGSLNLWIASVDSTHEEDVMTSPLGTFNSSKSITFKKREEPFQIGYGDGMTAKGHLAQDIIKIVVKKKELVLKDQVFGLAEHITKRSIDRDGVFGLGLNQQKLEGNPDPPFLTMTKQNSIEPVFGFYFNRDKDGLNSGELNFGGEDEDLVEGEFTYHDVIKINGLYRHWYINIKKMTVGKHQVVDHELQFLNMHALVDTGTNRVTGPKVIIDIIHQNIFKYATFEVSKELEFSCGVNWIELPDVTIFLDNTAYVLTPEDYVWGMKYRSDAPCLLAIGATPNQDYFIIGQPFMEKYYTQFDMGRKRVGLARAKTPY